MEILDALRGIRQTYKHVRMVFCGSIGMHHVMNALKKSGHTNTALSDLFTLPLPPLTPNHGADLARQLISGECLQCDDLNTISELLANSVDCVPFYIQSIVKELAINKAIVTADEIRKVVSLAVVAPQDPWHLRNFEERLESYYGKDRETVATAVMDKLAVAPQPLSIKTLQQAIASNKSLGKSTTGKTIQSGDLKPLRSLLEDLAQDHYVSQIPDTGHYAFQFPLIKKWWMVRRGLV